MTDAVLSQSPFQVTIWQPGHTYNPGDVVQPTTTTSAGASPPTNADFVASLAGWTASANVTWIAAPSYNANGGSARTAPGFSGETLTNNNQVAVTVGQTISALCYGGGNASIGIAANAFVTMRLYWYDSGHVLLGTTPFTQGPGVNVGAVVGLSWWKCTVSGSAPTGAAFCAVGVVLDNPSGFPMFVDAFYWDYIVPNNSAAATTIAYFTDVSSASAISGSNEPDWTNGGTNVGNVADGGITWARGQQETIQWICEHFCQSGNTEPTWPLTVGAAIRDGVGTPSEFDWLTRTPQILDSNCPQSKYVVLGASRIFAGDTDIVRYCAVINPTDWTTEDDAGFIGSGLNAYGSNPVAAVGLYRGNIAVFNSEACQLYQIDEDPEQIILQDVIPIGSTYQRALAPVNDDLFFLSAQGVRSISVSGGSGSLQSGDVGQPIDPIVQAAIVYLKANGVDPVAVYYPTYGQYMIVVRAYVPPSNGSLSTLFRPIATSGAYSTGDSIFVYTRSRQGEVGAWSRYVVPCRVDGFFFLGDDLCIRSGDDVLKFDPNAMQDFSGDTYNGASRASNIPGAVQWPYLDCGPVGIDKQFDSMDVSCAQAGNVTVEIGYDQGNAAAFTTPFTMPAETISGARIDLELLAPSISLRLSFTSAVGVEPWQVDAVNLYVQDQSVTS